MKIPKTTFATGNNSNMNGPDSMSVNFDTATIPARRKCGGAAFFCRSRQGFTLLEIMLVLLVIVLVMSVAYPSLSRGTAMLSLRTTGRDVLNAFRYAREKAITEQTGMQVIVDRENQKIRLTDDFGEGTREYLLPEKVRIQRVTLAGAETAEGPVVVRFLPNGSSDTAEILIQSETGAYLRIISDPISGGACIRSGPGEVTP
jgi:prepilin-type N-terminal cleavage/methylation domain-containing protein